MIKRSLSILGNQPPQFLAVGPDKCPDPFLIDLGNNDLPDFRLSFIDPHFADPRGKKLVVLGRDDIVHGDGLIAVDEKQRIQGHQPLLASLPGKGVLIADRQDVAKATILQDGEDDVGHLGVSGIDD